MRGVHKRPTRRQLDRVRKQFHRPASMRGDALRDFCLLLTDVDVEQVIVGAAPLRRDFL